MKKLLKIAGSLLLAIIVIAAAVFAFLWLKYPDTVKGIINGIRLDSQQIEQNKEKNEEDLRNTIKDLGFEVSKEDVEKLNKGEISQDELKDILLGKDKNEEQNNEPVIDNPDKNDIPQNSQVNDNNPPVVPEKDKNENEDQNQSVNNNDGQKEQNGKSEDNKGNKDKDVKPSASESTDKTDNENKDSKDKDYKVKDDKIREYEEAIADEVAKLYVLKNQFIGQIEGLITLMKADFNALHRDQRNLSAKAAIAQRYSGQIATLEAQCDVQVDAIVKEIKRLLTLCGKDASLADSLYQSYVNEKEITKSFYINLYSD